MRSFITIVVILPITLGVLGIITKWSAGGEANSNTISRKISLGNPTNRLMTISNLEDFYCQDYSDNLNYLTAYKQDELKEVKAISIYRYNGNQRYSVDSIILNRSGKLIMKLKPNEFNEFSRTYFFYDNRGNRYLDIAISDNNYDTTYTLRRFDQFNRMCKEINYNITRKENGRIFVINIVPISDSIINLKYEFFETDLNHVLLPFETRNIIIKQMIDSSVETSTIRIVHADTAYNSSYTDSYRLENNTLIPLKNKSVFDSKENLNWLEEKSRYCSIKRVFNYYKPTENEVKNEFLINQSIVNILNIKIDSLPILAWKKYRENLNAFSKRKKIFDSGLNLKCIELQEGSTIDNFTPQLWYLVSQDSGYIEGFKNKSFLVGYNTPLKNKTEFNVRCLAIYEKCNGKYILRKQSFGALEDFVDNDNDLMFNGFNETNFSVQIVDGNIIVNYSYMRGEPSYTFSYEKGNWILNDYESSHRTCCQAESYSYNYKTKKYSFSLSSTGETTAGDTAYTVIQERPIMYMDSINIRDFDYNETGLIAK